MRVPAQPPGARKQKQRFAYWYDAIIEWMLLNPSGTIAGCAKALGRQEKTLYLVVNSDIFKTRYEQRRREYLQHISEGLLVQTARVASKALVEMEKRLDNVPEKISTDTLSSTIDGTLERLGYGGKSPVVTVNNGPQQNVHVTVSPEVLSNAREKMRQLQQANAIESPIAKQIAHQTPVKVNDDLDNILDLEADRDA